MKKDLFKNVKIHTMVSVKTVIIAVVISLVLGAVAGLVPYIVDEINDKECVEIVYDVIAENETEGTYILQDNNDTNHYIEVDNSTMYGVGDTVIVVYVDEEITSIWLYVDC